MIKVKDINEAFSSLGIKDFWTVVHQYKYETLDFENTTIQEAISEYESFFENNNKIYKITYGNLSIKSLQKLIKRCIREDSYYFMLNNKSIINLPKQNRCFKNDDVSGSITINDNDAFGYNETSFEKYWVFYNENICCFKKNIDEKTPVTINNAMDSSLDSEEIIPTDDFTVGGKVLSEVISIFCELLNGNLIYRHQSLIKPYELKQQLFNENISMTNTPLHENIFDMEGIKCHDKYIIKKGKIVDCFNDLKSANELGMTAGDLFYNPQLKIKQIQRGNIEFSIENNMNLKNKKYIIFDDVIPGTLVFNPQTGNYKAKWVGKNTKGEKVSCLIDINVIKLINSIKGCSGIKREYNNICLADVIMDKNVVARREDC